MKKKLFLIAGLFLFITGITQAQDTRPELYSVAFYNLENLFDTIHDPGKNDHDFLPDGSMKWTAEKYEAKLKNMAQVLSELSRDKTPQGPAVIGVAEIENLRVLQDLVKEPAIADERYGIVHYEGPDRRGIDCALLFNPRQFTVYSSRLVLSEPFQGDTVHKTRGFLVVNGNLAGDRVCFIVNHWPSRGAEAPVRIHAGNQVRALTDSLLRMDRDLKIIIMGDMNDDPMDESMAVALGAKKPIKQVKKREDLYNPFWEILEDKGVGTLFYRGKWNLFDQIVISRSFFKPKQGELIYDHAEVFIRDYLIQQDGKYKGSPLRTHGGKEWLNGYSDHLPTILYLRRK
ncbi:MAG: endonuclease/exonuclease/phosphatase family protein [Bacteroides sp.]|nr:endonuclease/exonuclease/phosphatase family protein [Bacteroides sp.]